MTRGFTAKRQVRCRQIVAADLAAVGRLLARGFATRSEANWLRALDRLTGHPTPEGYPKYGYVLESAGEPVGLLLVVFTRIERADGSSSVRGNVTSWHVDPEFRSYAPLLTSHAGKHKEATIVNVSPGSHTWAIIEAQGFRRLCNGVHVGVPLAGRSVARAALHVVDATTTDFGSLAPAVARLLADHARFGCIAVRGTVAGRDLAFVFRRRRVLYNSVPCAQLVYCDAVEDVVALARPLGGLLARRGMAFLLVDANGPVAGLPGRFYKDTMAKYYRGPEKPRLGDLAYTEAGMFGFADRI